MTKSISQPKMFGGATLASAIAVFALSGFLAVLFIVSLITHQNGRTLALTGLGTAMLAMLGIGQLRTLKRANDDRD